jgi:hypothetical protein
MVFQLISARSTQYSSDISAIGWMDAYFPANDSLRFSAKVIPDESIPPIDVHP